MAEQDNAGRAECVGRTEQAAEVSRAARAVEHDHRSCAVDLGEDPVWQRGDSNDLGGIVALG